MGEFEFKIASDFRKTLRDLADGACEKQCVSRDAMERFREAFKLMGSYTDDNVSSIEAVDYDLNERIRGSELMEWSLSIRCGDGTVSISDVLWTLEELPPPPKVVAEFPGLDGESWSRMIRFLLMLVDSYSVDKEVGTG